MAREASPNFNMIGWNGMASMNQSIKGSFEFDVVFVNDKPGFVVQFIQKTLTYKKTAASSSWKKRNHAYWEIFYIGEDRPSTPGGITGDLTFFISDNSRFFINNMTHLMSQ